EGFQVEGARLPHLESSFDLRAYSKAGAAGIWQFIPATGRRFMRVDALVDERRDPFASTRAAALYLREVHRLLNSWPLAITAYNHGPQGMARAVRQVGTTDIASIIRQYDGMAFGFAPRGSNRRRGWFGLRLRHRFRKLGAEPAFGTRSLPTG